MHNPQKLFEIQKQRAKVNFDANNECQLQEKNKKIQISNFSDKIEHFELTSSV